MAGVNKAIVVGNLGADPDFRVTTGGQPVCRLSVATTRTWKNQNTNEQVSETEWHRITVWGKSAEHCSKYLKKGRQVYVEGRLRTSSYEQEGVKKYSTEIVAETVQFLGGKDGAGDSSGGHEGSEGASSASHGPEHEQAPTPSSIGDDDDIPF